MSLNSASLRSSLNSYTQGLSSRRELSTDQLNHGIELIRKVDSAIEAVQTKETSITESKVLSDQGKSAALAELATASAARFGFLSRVVEGQERDITSTKQTLFTVKAPASAGTDPLLQFLFGKEIRDRYHGLSQKDRDMAFVQAANVSEDPDEQKHRDAIVWAFQQQPGGALITADILRRVLEERARRLNPETVARLAQVELLHETFAGLRDAVTNWLRGLGGDPKKIFDELGGDEPAIPPMEVSRRQVQHV